MFDCPSCKAQTSKLIIFNSPKRLGCPNCGTPKSRQLKVNLGQVLDRWENVDKNGNVKTHRITVGKASEIDSRIVCKEDPKVVLNRHTGKPTQY